MRNDRFKNFNRRRDIPAFDVAFIFALLILTRASTPPQALRARLNSPISAIAADARIEGGMLAANHAPLTVSFTRCPQPVGRPTESISKIACSEGVGVAAWSIRGHKLV